MEFGVTFARSVEASADSKSEKKSLNEEAGIPEIEIMTIRCELVGKSLTTTNENEWKAILTVRPVTDQDPVELRATLTKAGAPVSETWTYLAAQDPPPYRYPNVYTRQD